MAPEPEPQSLSKKLSKPTQEIKQLRLRAVSRGLLKEQIIFSTREITEQCIGMHSGHFYVPKGSFLIFWTRMGSKYCGKVCEIEDSKRERRVGKRQKL